MNKFKYFEEMLYCDKKCFTTKAEIFNYVKEICGISSYNTFKKKLKQIEKYIYFSSFDVTNLMYLSLIKLALPVCQEILYIHKMMSCYLQSHSYISFCKCACSLESYNITEFSWCIPNRFMPIFTAYFYAATESKEATVKNFFNAWQKCLNDSLMHLFLPYSDKTFDIYYDWAPQFLAQNYFETLDIIYKKYSDSPAKKTILQDSTVGLTQLLIEKSRNDDSLSLVLTSVLKNYDKILASYTDDILYDSEKPFSNEHESKFINEYIVALKILSDDLLCTIQKNLKSNHPNNSSYAIAINNFADIEKQYDKKLQRISDIADSCKNDFETFFQNLYDDPYISKSLQNGQLIFHKDIKSLHVSQISSCVYKYYNHITEDFNSFIKYQKLSSSSLSRNYKTISPNTDYMKELKYNIKNTIIHFKKNIKKFHDLPTVLTRYCLGEILTWTFPLYYWYPTDILKLNYLVSSKYNFEFPVMLIEHMKKNGFTFPLPPNMVIAFLTHYYDKFDIF